MSDARGENREIDWGYCIHCIERRDGALGCPPNCARDAYPGSPRCYRICQAGLMAQSYPPQDAGGPSAGKMPALPDGGHA